MGASGRLGPARHIFREVQAIIQTNPEIQLASSFYEWMGTSYATTQVIGVRRQLDKDPDSISFVRLLGEVAANPQVLSRGKWNLLKAGVSHLTSGGSREAGAI